MVDVQHLGPNDPGAQYPPEIRIDAQTAQAMQGTIALVRENFVLPHLPAGPHDAIFVRGQGDTTITIPRGTAFVFAHVRAGGITIQNYNGVFVAHSRGGAISLQHVGGTGFAQSLRGPVTVDDSSFARLRVRTGTGNMLFRNCVAHQIEASSTYGSIVYDNGQFQPGLARFESQYGNVAVGVQNQGNGVQIGAHSGSGHIVSNYSDGTQVTGGDSDTEARVRGGGPVVTTSSQTAPCTCTTARWPRTPWCSRISNPRSAAPHPLPLPNGPRWQLRACSNNIPPDISSRSRSACSRVTTRCRHIRTRRRDIRVRFRPANCVRIRSRRRPTNTPLTNPLAGLRSR